MAIRIRILFGEDRGSEMAGLRPTGVGPERDVSPIRHPRRWSGKEWFNLTAASLAIAVAVTALVLRQEPAGSLLVASGFALTAVPIAFVDARTGQIPDRLVGVAFVTVCAVGAAVSVTQRDADALLRALASAGSLLAFYGALYFFRPGQLGGGDVKLAVPVGFMLGWHSWTSVVIGTFMAWFGLAVVMALARLVRRSAEVATVPLAPAMVASALCFR